MIVPDHWAEARRQHRTKGRQVTVRRFGWSDSSPAEAEAMAERRADEALQQILAGQPAARRERRVAYNGAEGVPIREEVLERQGEAVITRNAYGARCLNTPNALFADIDFGVAGTGQQTLLAVLVLSGLSVALGLALHSAFAGGIAWVLSLFAAGPLVRALHQVFVTARGGHAAMAQQRIHRFLGAHPDWNLRIYRTPGGLRLLATHAGFDATSPEVADFFRAVGADPLYVRMCLKQRCFRARLTAKPWRIGIEQHLRPRPGVWPVDPERLPRRQQWVVAYEQKAQAFAACHFQSAQGSGRVHPDLQAIVELHDRESRALATQLALA